MLLTSKYNHNPAVVITWMPQLDNNTKHLKNRTKDPSTLRSVSIILPLLTHGGHAIEAVESWVLEQTYPRELIELIVVSDGVLPELDKKIQSILTERDKLVVEPTRLYFRLLNVGAQLAHGDILFFVEPHAPGFPNTVQELVRFFNAENCNCVCGTFEGGDDTLFENLLDEIFLEDEAKYVVNPKSWRKAALRAFAIRKDVFCDCGPFEEEFGHFGERAFPIKLLKQGIEIEYAPELVVKHYNSPNLRTLDFMVQDYINGECLYRTRYSSEHCNQYLEPSDSWSGRAQYDRQFSGALLNSLARHLTSSGSLGYIVNRLPQLIDLLLLYVFGVNWPILKTKLRMMSQEIELYYSMVWNRRRCLPLLRDYWYRNLTRYTWLCSFKHYPEALKLQLLPEEHHLELANCKDSAIFGFFAAERHGEASFRWSHSEAVVRVAIKPGNYLVKLQILPDLVETAKLGVTACFDGNQMAPQMVSERSDLHFYLKEADFCSEAQHFFSFACRPTVFPGDSRRLGLPVRALKFERVEKNFEVHQNKQLELSANR